MSVVKANYDEMQELKRWMKQDETQEQLVALTAQLEQIKIKNKQLQAKLRKEQISKPQPKSNSKPKDNNKWKWKTVPPKANEKTKDFEGKTYYWCRYHKKWTLHKTEECRLQRKKPIPDPNDHNKQYEKKEEVDAFAAVLDDGAFSDL